MIRGVCAQLLEALFLALRIVAAHQPHRRVEAPSHTAEPIGVPAATRATSAKGAGTVLEQPSTERPLERHWHPVPTEITRDVTSTNFV